MTSASSASARCVSGTYRKYSEYVLGTLNPLLGALAHMLYLMTCVDA